MCGFVHRGNAVQHKDGAFAEYIVAKRNIQIRIPDNLSFQEATTLGVGISTVGQGLYQSLKLVLPSEPIKEPEPSLIYGGSTATDILVIQFAKLSGYTVLTTYSPYNFDLVKRLGADAVFDYKDPNSAAEIRKYTNNNLKLVFDTISLKASSEYCEQAISTEGGDYGVFLFISIEQKNVTTRYTLAYTIIGEEFSFGDTAFSARTEDKAFAEKFWAIAEKVLADGKVKVHQPKVNPGSLQGVLDGLKLLKEDKVSGEKLVYNVAETP